MIVIVQQAVENLAQDVEEVVSQAVQENVIQAGVKMRAEALVR